jgi:hypothetical protein
MESSRIREHSEESPSTTRILTAWITGLAVCVLSFLPSTEKHMLHTTGRLHLFGHALAFSLLSLTFMRAASSARTRLALMIALGLFGATLELLQHMIYAGEMLEWADIACDALGTILGVVAWRLLRKRTS